MSRRTMPPHLFRPDPDVPADPLTGDSYCRCGLKGRPGDGHHTMPEPVADVRQLAAHEED